MLEIAKGEAIHLMLGFCERFHAKTGKFNVLEGILEDKAVKSCCFFKETICNWTGVLNCLTHKEMTITHVDEENLALLWGSICCIPYFLSAEGNQFLMDLVDVVDKLLMTDAGIKS